MIDVVALFVFICLAIIPGYVWKKTLEAWEEKHRPKTEDEKFLEAAHIKRD